MSQRVRTKLEKFYSIGEVSDITGVRPNILRYWEQEFRELKPLRRRKGSHRLYSPREVDVVKSIKHLLKEEGLSIPGARKRLSESRQDELPFSRVSGSTKQLVDELKKELEELETLLRDGDQTPAELPKAEYLFDQHIGA